VSAPEGANWRPERPCREEVRNVVSFVIDSLTAAGLQHEVEQPDENPDAWSFFATDAAGYLNLGLISWNSDLGGVVYAALDTQRLRHDELEGFSEDESRCWLNLPNAEIFVWHLTGKLREVAARDRAEQIAAQRAEEERERRDAA
jgi:hypothetical protein